MRSLLAALVLVCCFSFYSNADTTTDLLDPSAQNWSGTYGTGYWAGTGGPAPNRIPNNSGFIWSSDANIIGTTIAINSALEQAGIQVDGFSYKWRVKNGNGNRYGNQPGVDDFKITVDVLKADGSVYQSYVYDYSHSHNWTYHTGSETFANNYLPPSYFSDINISAQGSDSAGWSGHYGPEFNTRTSEFKLNYSTNPCYENQLYSTSCLGYATAYYNQQCTANPLYNSGCSGYTAAHLTQQCNSNSLYSTACTGYSTAYYNQQCGVSALYDSGCTGYFEAQCDSDPLYDIRCTGYDTAYLNQQCLYNPQYDEQCTGYISEVAPTEVAIFDPIVTEAISVPTPIITIPVQETFVEPVPIVEEVIEEVVIEEVVIEEVVEEVVEEVIEEVVEEEVVEETTIINPKETKKAKAKAKAKKIKEIQQVNTQSLADKMGNAATFKVQQQVQTRLIAMLNFVPEFSNYKKAQLYGGKLQKEVNLKGGRIVDNAFARWFINDPNYDKLEELQYNLGAN